MATIRAKLANAPLPTPRGPLKKIAQRLMWGSVSGTVLTGFALIGFNTFGLASRVCTLPGLQPALSDSCGSVGLGGRPSHAERVAWEERMPGSCAALREHIAHFPDGFYRSEAADLLTARKVSIVETWQPASRALVLFEPSAGPPARDESTARNSALERSKPNSERLCRGFGGGTLYRYVSSSPSADRWSCAPQASGMVCGFDGHANCDLSERRQNEQEHCGL